MVANASGVIDVADHFGATAFDSPDTFWSHRGAQCSLGTMLDEFNLYTERFDRPGRVIRGADTIRHDLSPEAAGLPALSVGLSRQYRDEQDQLAAAMPLCDALCRRARGGADDGHDRPTGRSA